MWCSIKDCKEIAYTVSQGQALCKAHYEAMLAEIDKRIERNKKIQELIAQFDANQIKANSEAKKQS